MEGLAHSYLHVQAGNGMCSTKRRNQRPHAKPCGHIFPVLCWVLWHGEPCCHLLSCVVQYNRPLWIPQLAHSPPTPIKEAYILLTQDNQSPETGSAHIQSNILGHTHDGTILFPGISFWVLFNVIMTGQSISYLSARLHAVLWFQWDGSV